MFADTSRYAPLETATLELPDGRTVRYQRRRFVPSGASLRRLTDVIVTEGDRLDLIAARTLGDPEQFWRICDANDALHPDELTRTVGRVLAVPVPSTERPA
jgi:nucleoid-associated protein YgaU